MTNQIKQIFWDHYELPEEENGMYLFVGNHVIVINHGYDYTEVDICHRDQAHEDQREVLASAYADHEYTEDEQ